MRRHRGLGARVSAAAFLAAVPVAAARSPHATSPVASRPAPAPPAQCTPAPTSQPFLAFGDANLYTLVPGQQPDAFTGAGWTLSGGATVTSAGLRDGSQGETLDLPAGATAVSPPMCVTDLDPTARAMVRSVVGAAGVDIKVTYLTRHGHTVSTGNIKGTEHGWSASRVVHIHPSASPGWQLARFTLIARGTRRSDYRIYDFYVDPRMVH